ncbi:MAG: pilus assembly FimT family protein [Gammaproteobacteria bacterium]
MAQHVHGEPTRQRGFTITELLVVVIILGVLAAVVAPGIRSGSPDRVDLAAAEAAEAIRFARSEALRTGNVHGVFVEHNQNRVTVEKTDLSEEPVDGESVLYHPVTRQPYTFDLDDDKLMSGVTIGNTSDVFNYWFLGPRRRLLFDAQGLPVYMKPIAGETYHLMPASIIFELDGYERRVSIESYTGRVTIQ